MLRRWMVTMVLLSGVAMAGAGSFVEARQADAAQQAFEAARKVEVVDRDLRGAIVKYRDVIARFASDRTVAAEALYRLAQCYEQIGDAESRATLQRILRDYPDQSRIVALAKASLAGSPATATPAGLLPRRMLEPDWAWLLDMTADGRTTAGRVRAGWNAYSVVVRDVQTGRTRTLATGQQYGAVRISDDSQYVAFGAGVGVQNAIGIMSTAPGSTPRMIPAPTSAIWAPLDWSPDGKSLLVILSRYTNADQRELASTELAWLSSAGEPTVRSIWTAQPWHRLVGGGALPAAISRDGRFIAFTVQAEGRAADRLLYVISADGQREAPVVTAAGFPEQPVWTPDGRHLLFRDNRPDRLGLWAVAIQNGRAVGEPRRIYPTLGGTLLGMTTSGAFYYRRDLEGDGGGYGGNYVHVVDRASPSARPISFPGDGPSWSPDGRSVAFIREGTLIVRHVETGAERSHSPVGNVVVPPLWLHDGSALIVVTQDQPTRAAATFQRVDIATGVFRRLFQVGESRSATGALSADGKTLYVASGGTGGFGPFTGIAAVDITTGTGRLLANFPPGTHIQGDPSIEIAPDGTTLAVRVSTKPDEGNVILAIGVNGSDSREIVRDSVSPWPGRTLQWVRDGMLLFIQADASRNWRVMRQATADTAPAFDGVSYETLVPLVPDLRLSPGNLSGFDVSPDGRRIAISTQTLARSELWTLDNVLAALNRR